ncbi:hypothetical protein HYU13_03410 [Candidatus Woesearchaeota archaeon]|nr:hypothetical protein [Candidatus Woesearchaeota archaeon]
MSKGNKSIDDLADQSHSRLNGSTVQNPFYSLAYSLRMNDVSPDDIAKQLKRCGYDALNAYRAIVETDERERACPDIKAAASLGKAGYEPMMIVKAVLYMNSGFSQKRIKEYAEKLLDCISCPPKKRKEILSLIRKS